MRVRRVTRVLGVLGVAALATSLTLTRAIAVNGPTEAPTGFDGASNGFIMGPDFEEAKEEFTGPETEDDGLGPVFNGAGCGECHTTPVLGGTSQTVERRAGRFDGVNFFEHPGGSLIQDRALSPDLQETVQPNHNVIALRATISVLGDGFVEAISSNDLVANRDTQPRAQRGTLIEVPVLEAVFARRRDTTRAGRFGWKDQHASLLSFSADAYKNEMGITSPLEPEENTFNGRALGARDRIPDPEDDGADVQLFADFMRSTKAPSVNSDIARLSDAQAGSTLFNQIGCAVCHTRTFVTVAPGTLINSGEFRVPTALGDKIIHPFSDFLLHDIDTGDGIVQNGGGRTRNMLRTAALWGLRARGRFMHDMLSHSVADAIQRHGGQAEEAQKAFNALSSSNRRKVLVFLSSL